MRGILLDDHAKMIVMHGCVGKPYRPSNGTEGELFFGAYCADCTRQRTEHGCSIARRALFHNVREEGYPNEWIYGHDGQPACTAFEEGGGDAR